MSLVSVDWLIAKGVPEDLAKNISDLPNPSNETALYWNMDISEDDPHGVRQYRAKLWFSLVDIGYTIESFSALATDQLLSLFGSDLYPGEHIDAKGPDEISGDDWVVLSSLIMTAARMKQEINTSDLTKNLSISNYNF